MIFHPTTSNQLEINPPQLLYVASLHLLRYIGVQLFILRKDKIKPLWVWIKGLIMIGWGLWQQHPSDMLCGAGTSREGSCISYLPSLGRHTSLINDGSCYTSVLKVMRACVTSTSASNCVLNYQRDSYWIRLLLSNSIGLFKWYPVTLQ